MYTVTNHLALKLSERREDTENHPTASCLGIDGLLMNVEVDFRRLDIGH